MTINFFDLPPEIREHIYREIYTGLRVYVAFWVTPRDDEASREALEVTADPPSAKTFLSLSKTTYHESLHLFYSVATIFVTGYGRHDYRLRSWPRVLARLSHLRRHATHIAIGSGFDSSDALRYPEINIDLDTAFELEEYVFHDTPSITFPSNWTYYDLSLLQRLQRVTMYLSRPKHGKLWIYHSNVHQFAHLARGMKVVGRQSGRYVRAYARAMERSGSRVPRRVVVEVRWCLQLMRALEATPSLSPEHQFSKVSGRGYGKQLLQLPQNVRCTTLTAIRSVPSPWIRIIMFL